MSCGVTFDEYTQYIHLYLHGESSCIEDKDNSFLTENHILPKLSLINTLSIGSIHNHLLSLVMSFLFSYSFSFCVKPKDN